MTTVDRAARILRAQLARKRVAHQVAAAGDAPVVTIATDALTTLLADVDAALVDAEQLHLEAVGRGES